MQRGTDGRPNKCTDERRSKQNYMPQYDQNIIKNTGTINYTVKPVCKGPLREPENALHIPVKIIWTTH